MKSNLLYLVFACLFYHSQGLAQHPLLSSFEVHQALQSESPYHLKASALGPVVNSARAESVQVDLNNPGTMYLAFGSGNLWKTTDNGLSWRAIFDGQASHGIGDIALAPSNSDILYVGTGESLRKRRNFTLPGTGIYRSDDAGKTWRNVGLEDSWHIGEIVVHPSNPDIVFVAVMGKFWSDSKDKGIYKTENGGESWERVLYVNETTRANDIVIAPSNPSIVYASMWDNNNNEDLKESVYGPNSGVYKSIDGGNTWKHLINGFPKGDKLGRIGIAVSYQDPNKVYALIDNLNNKREHAPEVYRIIDNSDKWIRTHGKPLKFSSTIGWYFADIYLNPKNDEELFALGVQLVHSTDGGKTFNPIKGQVTHLQESIAQTLHLDHCELWINPRNPNHLALCNDGGLYTSMNKGDSWLHHNNIIAGEFYDITLTEGEDYTIYGGTQDDATVYGPATTFNPDIEDPWKYLWIDAWSGGDGCVTQVDPSDPNTIYFSMQNGAIRRMNFEEDSSKGIRPKFSLGDSRDLRYNFITPYKISKYNSSTLYHAGNFIFKSTNRGDQWNTISRDLGKSSYAQKQSIAAGAFAESPLKEGLLYVGMDHGAFWHSPDDGSTWNEASQSIANGYIRSISPSNAIEGRVYLAMTGLNYDDMNCYIYSSENNGKDWKLIKNNLPNEPANVILEDPYNPEILYAGLHRGLFISTNRGNSWSKLATEIPYVPISDLKINQQAEELVIATHGRGIYKLNLKPIYESYDFAQSIEAQESSFKLFKCESISAPTYRNTHKDVDLASIEELDIYFWSSKEQSLTMSIEDKSNKTVWSQKIIAPIGLKHIRWDLVLSTRTGDGPYFFKDKDYLDAGRYTLILSNNKSKQETSVLLRK